MRTPSLATLRLASLMALLGTTGCSLLYQPNIQQGNVLTTREIQSLTVGMTKPQVRYLLGTPPVRDVFHKNRWDYYFSFQKNGGQRLQQHLTLFFVHGALATIRGAQTPTPHFPTPTGASAANEGDSS